MFFKQQFGYCAQHRHACCGDPGVLQVAERRSGFDVDDTEATRFVSARETHFQKLFCRYIAHPPLIGRIAGQM